jgi:hypothetical protein
MLDATLYIAALNHAAFIDKSDASINRLKRIIDYCRAQGLRLATVPDGGLTVERDGMNPRSLHIAIDGYDGWAYRELRNRRACQYDWSCPMFNDGFHGVDEPCDHAQPPEESDHRIGSTTYERESM